jgi:hypothetical protein
VLDVISPTSTRQIATSVIRRGLDTVGPAGENERDAPGLSVGGLFHHRGPHRDPGADSTLAIDFEETMPLLTPEQREAVDQAIGREGYARIDDYIVLKAEVYDRLRAVLDDGLDMTQVGALVEAAMREDDAGDPLLDTYQSDRP